jgi:hypothetical protein
LKAESKAAYLDPNRGSIQNPKGSKNNPKRTNMPEAIDIMNP